MQNNLPEPEAGPHSLQVSAGCPKCGIAYGNMFTTAEEKSSPVEDDILLCRVCGEPAKWRSGVPTRMSDAEKVACYESSAGWVIARAVSLVRAKKGQT